MANLQTILLAGVMLGCAMIAQAQQAGKIPRVGFLSSLSPLAVAARTEAFRTGLRDLGYVEGKNIVIEWRYADGNAERLINLAAELVRQKVDIIVTGGPAVNRPAKEATATIPIVLAFDNDPVGNGFAASLAHPGGNITGLSTHYPEISGKQLELLKETLPKLARVGVLGNSNIPGNTQALKETELAASAFKIKLQYFELQNSKEIETTFRSVSKGRADAILVFGSQVVTANAKQFADSAVKHRLPAIYWSPEFVETGGLMAYSVSTTDLFRRAATYVDKIIKGTKPAELPIEQPMKFDFVVNLQAAKQIGLTIPPNVLVRATRVIK